MPPPLSYALAQETPNAGLQLGHSGACEVGLLLDALAHEAGQDVSLSVFQIVTFSTRAANSVQHGQWQIGTEPVPRFHVTPLMDLSVRRGCSFLLTRGEAFLRINRSYFARWLAHVG